MNTNTAITFPPTHDDMFIYPRGQRYWIGPREPADLIASVKFTSIKAGGLRIDEKEVPGTDGATRTFLGYEDAEWEFQVQIWDFERQYNEIKRIAKIFRQWQGFIVSNDGNVANSFIPKPMRVLHPALSRWGISAGILFNVSENGYTARDGLIITFSFKEYQEEYKQSTKKDTGDKKVGTKSGMVDGDLPEGWDITQGPKASPGTSGQGSP